MNTNKASTPAQSETSRVNVTSLPNLWIERIFSKMEDRYGNLWANSYGAFPRSRVMQTWSEDLSDLSKDELGRGMKACRDKPFPPTLPEFRKMCRPPIDPEAAYHEAIEQFRRRKDGTDNWSHPAIFWTAIEIGEFDLKISNWQSMQSRWTSKLKSTLEKRDLPEIPPRREALTEPGQTTPDAAKVARYIDGLKAKLRVKNNDF